MIGRIQVNLINIDVNLHLISHESNVTDKPIRNPPHLIRRCGIQPDGQLVDRVIWLILEF